MYYFYQPIYNPYPYSLTNRRMTHPTYHLPYYHTMNHPINERLSVQVNQPANEQPSNTNGSFEYPPVDSTLLYQSANQTKKLMEDVTLVLDHLASSKDFDAKIMHHAQRSNVEEVKRLIHSVGIKSNVDIDFNPDGLRLDFSSELAKQDCCRILIVLRWR